MELWKLTGAGMILTASVWTGLREALRLRGSHKALRDLLAALNLLETEISFAAVPFAPLCRRGAEISAGGLRRFFEYLAREAARPEFQSAGLTRRAAAEAGLTLSNAALEPMERLFDNFGRWDREGQLDQLRLTRRALELQEAALREGLGDRCRGCGILGFCGGAAVLVMVL